MPWHELQEIPQQHVEKDFWITEALRGVANASRDTARHYYDVDVLLRSRAVLKPNSSCKAPTFWRARSPGTPRRLGPAQC